MSIYITLACGQLSLVNAAFMGIGAYSAALITMKLGAPFGVSLVAGGLLPAVVALIIGVPVLRRSGVYLAMATLGFGEVVTQLAELVARHEADLLIMGSHGHRGVGDFVHGTSVHPASTGSPLGAQVQR